MKNNLSFGFYSTCTLAFWLPNLVKFDQFHSLLSMKGSLQYSTVQELICKNEFLLLMSHEIALKRICWINLQRKEGTECVKLPLGTLV